MSLINKIKNIGLALVLVEQINSCVCSNHNNSPKEPIQVEANVGEYLDNIQLNYAGMNSESSFSLYGIGNSGENVYYPTSSKIIQYKKNKFEVILVTPEKIILKNYSRR